MEVPASFEGKDFYEILGVENTADSKSIRKAYRKKALRFHPDHNKAPTAKDDFQFLAKVHETLSDEKKRAYYDKYGECDVELSDDFDQAYDYWRTVFPKITEQDIEDFRTQYIGSEEEDEDLIKSMTDYKGDMKLVMESVPFAEHESLDRLVARVQELFQEGKLKKTWKRKFNKSIKNLDQELTAFAEAEEEEADEMKKELGLDASFGQDSDTTDSSGIPSSLAMMIQARHQTREQAGNSFEDYLMNKYCQPEKSKAGKAKGKGKKKKAQARNLNNSAGKENKKRKAASAASKSSTKKTKQQR